VLMRGALVQLSYLPTLFLLLVSVDYRFRSLFSFILLSTLGTLRQEKGLSVAQVVEHLVEQGHSMQIVQAIRESLIGDEK
jgi:hypothetical protein